MLILSTLIGLPLYCTVPAYFVIGVLFAVLYLPRTIKTQARTYSKWRAQTLQGTSSFIAVLAPKTDRHSEVVKLHPQEMLDLMHLYHPDRDFSERHVIRQFIANIAIWPVTMPYIIWNDLLDALIRAMWRHFARLVVRVAKALWRFVRAAWTLLRSFWTWLYSLVQGLYQAIIVRANREALDDLKKMKEARHDN